MKSKPLPSCSLVIPGLLDFPTAQCRALCSALDSAEHLEWFFARAEPAAFPRSGLSATLFELVGIAIEDDRDLPVAAVGYGAEGGRPAKGFCLRADPVHLTPNRDQLILSGPEALALSLGEAQALVQELNTFFAEDGWHLEAPAAHRWYLHMQAQESSANPLRTYELAQVRGRAIGNYLPLGAAARHWRAILNEIQMFLHTSSINLTRQSEGKLPVSSLWFWGGGHLPRMENRATGRWDSICSEDVLGSGLARLCTIANEKPPHSADEWLATLNGQGEHLLILDDLHEQWLLGGEAAWQEAVQGLQERWIAPLRKGLRNKTLAQLTVYTLNGKKYRLAGRGLKRWWKPRRSLAAYCGED